MDTNLTPRADAVAWLQDFLPSPLDEHLVGEEVRKLRVRDQARRIVNAERRGPLPPFDLGTLREVLARPAQPPNRVEGLIPWQASTLITAQRKTGKTTIVGNLARSLLTGENFLGCFTVRPINGAVALLNYEVSGATLAGWADDMNVPADRLVLVNLRGRRNPLANEEDREQLAGILRAHEVETVIVDPFGRAYTGTSQNDAGEVGTFLADLDRFARAEVGALDLILTVHAGWNMERTRGSSALEDWADSIITMTRDDAEDSNGERYLRAIGRDVDLEEDQLVFDPETRTLTLAGSGSRKAARGERRHDELRSAALRIVTDQPGINGSQVETKLRETGVTFQRGEHRKALQSLVNSGQIVFNIGPKNAKCYTATTPTQPDSPDSPPIAHGLAAGDSPLALIGRATNSTNRPAPATHSGRANCTECGEPLHPVLIQAGDTTHPTCDAA